MTNNVAIQIRKRAGDVRQDGAYCGLFELIVWAALKNVRVLCSFGTAIQNVYRFCGRTLPQMDPKPTIRVAAVYCTAGGLFSADKPGLAVPEVNHFVAAREQHKGTCKYKACGIVRKFEPCGRRRTA